MAGNSGSDFTLELVVGIKDLFSQKAKQIDAEVNRLDRDTQELQKTYDDVSAYKKASRALEDLMRQGNASTDDIRKQEKELEKLSRSLRQAGVDINNITRDEERLARQIRETNQEMKKRSGFGDLVKGGVTAVASAGMLKGFLSLGGDEEKIRKLMQKQSNFSMEDIYGQKARDFRSRMVGTYKVAAGEVAGTQTWFNRQNQLHGDKNYEATGAALKLGNLMEGQIDQESINRAMTQMMATGMSGNDAGALLYKVFKNGRGDAGEMMDSFQEYVTNLISRGMNGEQIAAALIAGTTEGGVFSYDKVLDSLKETWTAKLSDPAVYEALFGDGKKKKGDIEEIKDQGLRYKLRSALSEFQKNQSAGKNVSADVGNIYSILGDVAKTDPAALGVISQHIGGTILTEDASKDAPAAIGKAISTPGAYLGDYRKDFDVDPSLFLTKTEQLEADKMATMTALGQATADATSHLDGFSKAIHDTTMKLTSMTAEHQGGAEMGVEMLMGGMLLGNIKGAGRMIRGAGSLLGMGGGAAAGGGFLSRIGGMLSGGAGRVGGMLGGGARFLGPLAALGGGAYSAWDDYQKGDMRGVAGDVTGTLGGVGAGAAAGALVGSVVPVIGTAIGGIVGGALGYWGGEKLGESLYDWWNEDDEDDKSQEVFRKQTEALPTAPELTAANDAGSAPIVELSYAPQIQIQAMSANPDDISKALEDALRQSNPELIQMLEYALSQIMKTNDHQRTSN
ncbi:hypothetical protein OVA10_03440 [Lelliottia sp. SL45]|uniref:hypothetical protein n=1 Tax=Lelliottia sp. SL45 TaxID=2994665 RepID=UPI002275AC2D|nr:hypothetical protein [Lelliottia sp. SL45]MCY1697142.1 hypothetical protein [Lelliottia sp. SL45]